MKSILPLLPKPSHYLGTEEGSVHKPSTDVRFRCVLAFPDAYEVGMSYLGHKILYGILNAIPEIQAERVFAPPPDAGKILKAHNVPLATLESDTPLAETHMIGFAITHELCCTNILYMLDLAGIPLRAEQRAQNDSLTQWPLIVGGGGCAVAAEPITPFMDVMLLGEGENLVPEFCHLLMHAHEAGWTRNRFLREAALIPGVYVPEFFVQDAQNPTVLQPIHSDLPQPTRRIVADFDAAQYPVQQVVPFGAVHNRLSLEIARGCTRGCRFCQAGILYRPARERKMTHLHAILDECLRCTGFDDVSFLSLSAGDFSGLKTLFLDAADRCAQEQISLSLPSLRVGSIDDAIMRRMADIRRTGATLAPEAGSQRLRDVINKGITEEGLIIHTQKLFQNGWQQVKLYFMIGLPTECDDDLSAITDLCRKVRDAAGRGMPRLQVTASLSPFVPKAHTPFQWEAQISKEEMVRRINLIRDQFKKEKNLKVRWHEPDVSVLEGLLSRGDRRLSSVIEAAYRKGSVFTDWMEYFSMEPWIEALNEAHLDVETFTRARSLDETLPWDHLGSGISRAFLYREREHALNRVLTEDCRYAHCLQCGVCDTKAAPSLLARESTETKHCNQLNFAQRDQEDHQPLRDEQGNLLPPPPRRKPTAPPAIAAGLAERAVRYRIWHTKEGEASFLSQLELQSFLDRLLRRAGLPLSFSQGFHPLPLISFGRALPVSVESHAEWFSVTLRQPMSPTTLRTRLEPFFEHGLQLKDLELIPIHDKSFGAKREEFILTYTPKTNTIPSTTELAQAWTTFMEKKEYLLTRKMKKNLRTDDIRPIFEQITHNPDGSLQLTMDWTTSYISPLTLIREITPNVSPHEIHLLKCKQHL